MFPQGICEPEGLSNYGSLANQASKYSLINNKAAIEEKPYL